MKYVLSEAFDQVIDANDVVFQYLNRSSKCLDTLQGCRINLQVQRLFLYLVHVINHKPFIVSEQKNREGKVNKC